MVGFGKLEVSEGSIDLSGATVPDKQQKYSDAAIDLAAAHRAIMAHTDDPNAIRASLNALIRTGMVADVLSEEL